MSKVSAPLLSFGASGQIAKTQVYAEWKGRPYVRRHVIPANPRSSEQTLTRNTFKYLTNLFKFFPGSALDAWNAYADSNRFTARNGFIKLNNGVLREETDLDLMTISPSARGGLAAAAVVATPGSGQLSIALTAPTLPTGWTITQGIAVAVQSVDPQTSDVYDVAAGVDASAPYTIVLTGLDTVSYVYGGWFEYMKPDGTSAWGPSVGGTATPS